MKRLALFTITLVLALGIAMVAAAGQATKEPAKKSAGKTMTASGKVTAVVADSISIMKGKESMKFAVDAATIVQARGAGTKSAAPGGLKVMDAVHEGDMVTVSYHDMGGGVLHAARIRVTAGAGAKKK
ncbi:MAG: hypothetical protein HYS05_02520 [Acidobacteria bacterium]|nr:hypothetical protein [Acidobacteriota bacterium]